MTHGEASLFGGLVIEHEPANSLDREYMHDAPAGVIALNQHPYPPLHSACSHQSSPRARRAKLRHVSERVSFPDKGAFGNETSGFRACAICSAVQHGARRGRIFFWTHFRLREVLLRMRSVNRRGNV